MARPGRDMMGSRFHQASPTESPQSAERAFARIAAWCARRWQAALAVIGLLLTCFGLYLNIRASRPWQQLGYCVVRRSEEVFNARANPHLRFVAAIPGTGEFAEDERRGEGVLSIDDSGQLAKRWEPIDGNVSSFEIEIVNCGRGVLWYDQAHHDGAEPICIETCPKVRVLDAHVLGNDSAATGFRLTRDERWDHGEIECAWRRLADGESATVRVVHLQEEAPVRVVLTGELDQCLAPRRLSPPKTPSVATRMLRTRLLAYVLATAFGLWLGSGLLAVKRQVRDKQLLRGLEVPHGIRPSILGYWRHELVLHLWLLVIIVAFAVWLLLF